MTQVSWSACRDDQTSADTQKNGEAVGAMSWVSTCLRLPSPRQPNLCKIPSRHLELSLVCVTSIHLVAKYLTCIYSSSQPKSVIWTAPCSYQVSESDLSRTLYVPTEFLPDTRAILEKNYSQKSQLSSSHPIVSLVVLACDNSRPIDRPPRILAIDS